MIKRLSMVLIFLFLFLTYGFCETSPLEKFLIKVVDLVIKRDVQSIYNLGTENFKKSLTIDQLKSMLNMVFSYYEGEPAGGEIVGVKYYPSIDATEMWFKLNFKNKKWLYIGCVIQRKDKQLYLYSLRLKVPPEFSTNKGKIPSVVVPAADFAKKVLFMVSRGEIDKVMELVYEDVKTSVGEQNIRSFLKTLAGFEMGKLNKEPIEVEISLRKSKADKTFKVLDINAYKK